MVNLAPSGGSAGAGVAPALLERRFCWGVVQLVTAARWRCDSDSDTDKVASALAAPTLIGQPEDWGRRSRMFLIRRLKLLLQVGMVSSSR